MKKIKSDIIPLALSILILLIGLGICLTSKFGFGLKQYFAFTSVVIATILYFKNKKIYFLFFAIVLTLGVFGLLDFYYRTYLVGFGEFRINPLYIGLLILFFAFSKSEMDKQLSNKKEPKKRVLDENLVSSFESKFKGKTDTKLTGITKENSKFTEEAKTAAKRILEKKNVL